MCMERCRRYLVPSILFEYVVEEKERIIWKNREEIRNNWNLVEANRMFFRTVQMIKEG